MILNNLADAQETDVVFFHYQGEGKPARNRLAKVLEVHDTYVHTLDLETHRPRNFVPNKASTVERIATGNQLVYPRDELLQKLFKNPPLNLDGESVARILKLSDPTVSEAKYYDNADAIIVTPVEKEPSLEVVTTDQGYVLTFTNSNGHELCLESDGPTMTLLVVDQNKVGINKISQPKVKDFVNELVKFFS